MAEISVSPLLAATVDIEAQPASDVAVVASAPATVEIAAVRDGSVDILPPPAIALSIGDPSITVEVTQAVTPSLEIVTRPTAELTVNLTGVGIQGPPGPAGTSGGSQVYAITIPDLGPGVKSFPGLLPVPPDLTGGKIVGLIMSGVGPVQYLDTGTAAGAQFTLSGPGETTVDFGYAPDPGDYGIAIYTPAS